MTLTRRSGSIVAMYAAAVFLANGAKLIVSIFVARAFGVSAFAFYSTAFAFTQIVAFAYDAGLTEWTLLAASRDGEDFQLRPLAICVLGIGVLATTAGLLLSPSLVDWRALSLVLPMLLMSFSWAAQSTFQSYLRARHLVVSLLILRILQLVLLGAAICLSFFWSFALANSLLLLACAELMSATVFLAWSVRCAGRQGRRESVPSARTLRSILPFFFSTIAAYVYLSSDAYVLSRFGTGRDVGSYQVGYRFYTLLTQVAGLLLGAVLPRIYAARGSADESSLLSKIGRLHTALVCWLVTSGVICVPIAIRLLYGAGFFESQLVGLALMLSLAVKGVGFIPAFILTSNNLQHRRAILLWVVAAFNLGSNLLLIPRLGIAAAVGTTLASDLLLVSCYVWFAAHLGSTLLSLALIKRYLCLLAGVIVLILARYCSLVQGHSVGGVLLVAVISILLLIGFGRVRHSDFSGIV